MTSFHSFRSSTISFVFASERRPENDVENCSIFRYLFTVVSCDPSCRSFYIKIPIFYFYSRRSKMSFRYSVQLIVMGSVRLFFCPFMLSPSPIVCRVSCVSCNSRENISLIWILTARTLPFSHNIDFSHWFFSPFTLAVSLQFCCHYFTFMVFNRWLSFDNFTRKFSSVNTFSVTLSPSGLSGAHSVRSLHCLFSLSTNRFVLFALVKSMW